MACGGVGARRLALVALACLLTLVGCASRADVATPASCWEQAAPFVAAATDLLRRWDETLAESLAVSEQDLGPYVERLAALRSEASALEPPECAHDANVALQRYMDAAIEWQTALWSQECRTCIADMAADAQVLRERALAAVEALSER